MEGGRIAQLASGRSQLNPAELLFEKIEDEQIERQVQKLHATKTANEAAIPRPSQIETG